MGVHHVAFEALSREAVDDAWQRALAQGVATESAPKEFPHYAPGYYAAFFYDPDGIKLEVVYEPTRAKNDLGIASLRIAREGRHRCGGRFAELRGAAGREGPLSGRSHGAILLFTAFHLLDEMGAWRPLFLSGGGDKETTHDGRAGPGGWQTCSQPSGR